MGDSKDLQQIAADAGKLVTIAFQLKSSILHAINFVSPLMDLKGVDFAAALAEVKSLSSDDLLVVEKVFFLNVTIDDTSVMARLQAGQGYFEEALSLVVEALDLVAKGKDLEQRIQKYFQF